jgi:fructose-specific phosphotransferase system component IIB
MITTKGASGYARHMYDEAYKKIYQTAVKVAGGTVVYDTMTSEDILTLDMIIMARRVVAIDKNRAERGMPVNTQTGFLNSVNLN